MRPPQPPQHGAQRREPPVLEAGLGALGPEERVERRVDAGRRAPQPDVLGQDGRRQRPQLGRRPVIVPRQRRGGHDGRDPRAHHAEEPGHVLRSVRRRRGDPRRVQGADRRQRNQPNNEKCDAHVRERCAPAYVLVSGDEAVRVVKSSL